MWKIIQDKLLQDRVLQNPSLCHSDIDVWAQLATTKTSNSRVWSKGNELFL